METISLVLSLYHAYDTNGEPGILASLSSNKAQVNLPCLRGLCQLRDSTQRSLSCPRGLFDL